MATHGSLTKAGKVRGQTPKVEGRKIVGDSSSVANKSNFKKRFALGSNFTINFKIHTLIKYWYRTIRYG
jgi:small subunit ribosomal protein S30e